MPASRSFEGRIIACLAKVFPKQSQPGLIVGDLLDDAPKTEPGEAQFVADAHSVILALVGAIALFPAIGAMAAIDWLVGRSAANHVGAILFVPSVFLMTVAILVQLAKFRRRFDGVQPHLGNGTWTTVCVMVVLSVVLLMWSA